MDAERMANDGESVQLMIARLAESLTDLGEIIAINGGGAGGDGTGGALGGVELIAADAVLRRDVGSDHFETIELRGDLEEGAVELGPPMELTGIADDRAYPLPTAGEGLVMNPLTQATQRDEFELANPIGSAVDPRSQSLAVDLETMARLLVGGLSEARQPFKPIHSG